MLEEGPLVRLGGGQSRAGTYQLAVQPARVAVELVVEASTPQRSVGRTAIRALGLDAAGGGVAGAVLLRGVHGCGARTSRASAHRLRAHAQRRPLAVRRRPCRPRRLHQSLRRVAVPPRTAASLRDSSVTASAQNRTGRPSARSASVVTRAYRFLSSLPIPIPQSTLFRHSHPSLELGHDAAVPFGRRVNVLLSHGYLRLSRCVYRLASYSL